VQDSCEGDESQKRAGELVIAGGNAPVPFKGTEEVLDAVTLAVEATMKRTSAQPLAVHLEARENAPLKQHRPQRIRVVALVANQCPATASLQMANQFRSSRGISQVAAAQQELNRAASGCRQAHGSS
jgi:hypothetical protein